MLKRRLMTPGPTPVHPEASLALGADHPHHRTPEFKAILQRLRRNLGRVFRTGGEVVVLTSSGTGAMEAALTNLTRPDDQVAVVDSGKFGQRWLDLSKAFQRRAAVLAPPARRHAQAVEIESLLRENPGCTALFFAATESSTGARADVQALARAARAVGGDDLLIVVDAITEVGAAPLEVDDWDLDVVIGGSQKAFMIPPGLAMLSLSRRAEERLEVTGGSGLYFDLARELAAQKGKSTTAWTPATALFIALDVAVGKMIEAGMEQVWSGTERLARMTREGLQAMGLELFSETPALSLTAVSAPEGIDSGKVVSELESAFGIRMAGGQANLKGKIFRIAHLGFIDEVETLGTLGALGITLQRLGAPVDVAAGLAAASLVMGESPGS